MGHYPDKDIDIMVDEVTDVYNAITDLHKTIKELTQTPSDKMIELTALTVEVDGMKAQNESAKFHGHGPYYDGIAFNRMAAQIRELKEGE